MGFFLTINNGINMKLEEFTYDLPEELIAKYPTQRRTDSRLLVTKHDNDTSSIKLDHRYFKDIINLDLFKPGDLLVLNNTKVIPARFYGQKLTGAKLEFLLERIIDETTALVHMKSNRTPKLGSIVKLHPDGVEVTINDKQDNLFKLALNNNVTNWYELLEKIGEMPLPPYINRGISDEDRSRYQTVYAKNKGAVAAPTAGLHFDEELLSKLQDKGVIVKFVTLHVGSGTFAPVRVDNIKEHKMHSEFYSVDDDLIETIIKLKQNSSKNKIIAVGTTSLRCLESIAKDLPKNQEGELEYQALTKTEKHGDTDIFIYPGFEFKLVDSLITNFHLPGSTLMMLVSALAGMNEIREIYKEAVLQKYRFFSYGDAMWLNRKV